MARLRSAASESALLREREEEALLYGWPLLTWPEWSRDECTAWLRSSAGERGWRRWRQRIVHKWLAGAPEPGRLPAASKLYDSRREQRQLERLARARRDELLRRYSGARSARAAADGKTGGKA